MSSAISVPARKGTLRSYLELCRASNLPTVWTNALAAIVLSGGAFSRAALAAGLSVTLSYLGGMALNDVLDVEEDRLKKPERPIPSGRISKSGALAFTAVLFAAALLLLAICCGAKAALAGVALIVTIYLYDSLHSKSWLTVLLMASCRLLVFIVVGLAVAGVVGRLVAIAGTVQFLYIVALTVVARWEKQAPRSFKIPPIPWMLAAISLIDGLVLAAFAAPAWLLAGVVGFVLTRLFQTQVRGD